MNKRYYTIQVFIVFQRKSYHEVEFKRPPALFHRRSDGIFQILLRVAFVDNFSQSVRSGFRGQGKSGLTHFADLLRAISPDSVSVRSDGSDNPVLLQPKLAVSFGYQLGNG